MFIKIEFNAGYSLLKPNWRIFCKSPKHVFREKNYLERFKYILEKNYESIAMMRQKHIIGAYINALNYYEDCFDRKKIE